MMKNYKYLLPLLIIIFTGAGCKKFLNINHDPNNPSDVQESLLLVPIETATATVIAGGSLTVGNYPTIEQTTSYWVQQIALVQLPPQLDEYQLRPFDLDQIFLTMYSTILENARILNKKAEQHGNNSYAVIAKILTVYNLGITTDMWGDIPYSKGLAGNLKPTYDKQEDVYKTMQSLLDSAIAQNALAPGASVPGSDDLIYGGNMSSWEKFAYTLKARYDIHLTKAPGHDPVTQANLALTDLTKGFTSASDEANFSVYSSSSGSESPWYENSQPAAGPNVLSSTFVDSLVNRNDPRLPVIAAKGFGGTYLGDVIGSPPAPDFTIFSQINTFFTSKSAPQSILSYSEALFIRAEAIFRTAGAVAATPAYMYAINSSMAKFGLDTTSSSVLSYIASRSPLNTSNGLQRIIEEKTVANFLSIENYNDWRRTGYPLLTIVQNPHIPSIPRRFVYPFGEQTSNPQPQQSAQLTDRVWWDTP